jgi:DNA repair exonuclease SbcCD nuclease subunit
MSINILHISDLHFCTKSNQDSIRYNYDNDDFETLFIKKFISYNVNYLIISGDISNESKPMEYDTASKFLNNIVKGLNIPKKNVLMCMGNHDISWRILEDIADIDGKKDLYKRKEKYTNFEKFYNDFYKESDTQIPQFTTDSIFVQIPDDTHRLLFLGVNTCYHESNQKEDHYGYIDKASFETYLKNMDSKYDDYVKFLVMHHNPMDLCREQNSVKNWIDISRNKLGYPFVVLCGHIHGSDTTKVEKETDNSIYYISVGSLLQKSTLGKCNLYTISDDSSKLQIQYFNFHDDINISDQYWQEQTASPASKEVLLKQHVIKNDVYDELMSRSGEKAKQQIENQQNNQNQSNDEKPTKSILDEIKDNQLYYSGHFHWDTDGNGENSKFRSHGYIDINHLVSRNESLETITQLYKEKIKEIQKNTALDKTIMVSIGLECSVIGARLSVLFPDFGFSYIPRKHKSNDHTTVENEIGFSDYKSVILIKDITFDADEAIEIMEERFKKMSIHLISLFYCGKKDYKNEILSGVENAHFYSLIDDIEIPRCDVSELECPIIKNNLQTIYRC